MTQDHLDRLSLDQLVTMFTEMAIEQSKAMFASDSKKYNRLLDQMIKVKAALKALPGDQRRALLPLHNHRNAQVRLTAAIATLEQEPKASRQVFQILSDRHEYPQAADARGWLKQIDGDYRGWPRQV